MAKVAICMAIDIMYTVLLIRLGSNSLYRSANCSALQDKKEDWNVSIRTVVYSLVLSPPYSDLPGWTSALCLFVKVHQTTEMDSKLQQHSQHRIKIEDVR